MIPRLGVGVAAVTGGAVLLLWPALFNGYPLLFSDTASFLAQGVLGSKIWDKPYVFGPVLQPLHGQTTLWGPVVAQALLLSWLLWRTARVVLGWPAGWRHLLLCAVLAGLTGAPWFVAFVMPDILAPALVLALFLLGFAGDRIGRGERVALTLVAAFAAAAHLAHLPIAAALVGLTLLVRRAWRPTLATAAPLGLALAVLVASNVHAHGRPAISPYGAVFALARMVGDGPAARTIEARCPDSGWHLCGWVGRLSRDSDNFLWDPASPVWAPRADGVLPGGPISLAPEARAVVAETIRREPLGVLRAGVVNTLIQLGMARVGDTLGPDWLAVTVGQMLGLYFPAAEFERFLQAHQPRGELRAAAAPYLLPHVPVLVLGAVAAVLGWGRAAWRGDGLRLGLILCVLVGVTANAAATGALSGPHDRYGARIAWLLPLAGALAWWPGVAGGARRRGAS